MRVKDPKEGYLLRATAFSKMRCSGGPANYARLGEKKHPVPRQNLIRAKDGAARVEIV